MGAPVSATAISISARTPPHSPWYVQQFGTPGYFVIITADGKPVPMTEPNAQLMAAAPALARVLAEFLRCDRVKRATYDTDIALATAADRAGALLARLGVPT